MKCQQILPGQEPALELMLQCFCTLIIPYLCEYPLIVEQPCDSSVQGKSRIWVFMCCRRPSVFATELPVRGVVSRNCN